MFESTTERKRIIGADIPLDSEAFPIADMLSAFHGLSKTRDDVHLVLTGKRVKNEKFSIWNFLDQNEITDRVTFLPYYERCTNFPIKKTACWHWISRNDKSDALSAGSLITRSAQPTPPQEKLALFVTCFHPERYEGNARLMRRWLEHLRAAGYRIHLLYYATDRQSVSTRMQSELRSRVDLYREVDVTTKLVGRNREGLNVHVDDWCGKEALDAASDLASKYEYDVAVVNYAFMSAIFDGLHSYTQKILITHDSFADRNRRMYEQGYSSASWVSLDKHGEKEAMARADIVVALQEHEAGEFAKLCGDAGKIRVVSPVFPTAHRAERPRPDSKLRIGYFGSANWVNEQNLALYLRAWLQHPALPKFSEIVLAGGICENFVKWVEDGSALLEKVRPTMLGKVQDLNGFFDSCDLVINPERGGTGIKIKTLEAMASHTAVLSTAAGAFGIGSVSRFHNAADANALAELTAEVACDLDVLQVARQETIAAYSLYVNKNDAAMAELLGAALPSVDDHPKTRAFRQQQKAADGAPLVSIVVPFYGVQDYIEDCICSILDQDYANIEVIFVDDASPDGSRGIVDRYAAIDERVVVVPHETNQGLGPARNTGVQHAKGAYLLFLDSDDLLASPSAISSLVGVAQEGRNQVIVGSCLDLLEDGAITEADSRDARGSLNAEGGEVRGVDAFLAGLRFPNGYYLPARAWGALIDSGFYRKLGLEFPKGEHEDLGHTPFMYGMAGSVLFLRENVVLYRKRRGSISQAAWSKAQIERYRSLWHQVKENIRRFALDDGLCEAAMQLAWHMIWRMQANTFDSTAKEEAVSVLEEIFRDITEVSSNARRDRFFSLMDHVRQFLGHPTRSEAGYKRLLAALPTTALLGYYRDRLGITQALQVSSGGEQLPRLALSTNSERIAAIFKDFQLNADDEAKTLTAMLTFGDRAMYFHAGRTFSFSGAIVDSGCFVGGTTVNLADGIACNPRFTQNRSKSGGLIRVYDLFEIGEDYIRDYLKAGYPDWDLKGKSSFQPIFSANTKRIANLLDVRAGDVTRCGYSDADDIEVFGVDLCKGLNITDFIVREFFPRLKVGALVLQQDYIHEYHPYIHLSMAYLMDHFEKYVELDGGGTVAFKCSKRITNEVITSRFGKDSTWYGDMQKNVPLLEGVIEDSLYDYNRFILIMTLGIYYSSHGRHEDARLSYQRARVAYPKYTPNELTRRMLQGH